MFEAIKNFISRYVVMGADELTVTTAHVLHSWQFSESCQAPNTTPYLYIHSAQKGSGKTLLGIDIMDLLARNPMATLAITSSALFRIVEDVQPTLLIDEVDAIFSGSRHEELRSVINAGYRRGARVPRVQGGEVQMFSPYCPKVMVGIDNGMLPDTIRDRCIPIHMNRATNAESANVQPFYHYEIEDEVEVLVEQIHGWSVQNTMKIHSYKPQLIPNLTPRQWEICMPLLQVAHAVGNEKTLRKALANILTATEERTTPEQDMLRIIRELFNISGKRQHTTNEILHRLTKDPRFAGLTGKGLSTKLAPFGIKSGGIRLSPTETQRGYKRSTFEDAWSRYL